MAIGKLGYYLTLTWLASIIAREFLLIIYCSSYRFRIWWYRRQGRHVDAHAIIAGYASSWGRRVMKVLSCEVEVLGLENLPATGPYIVMTNHQSLFDIPIFLSYFGVLLGFVAKRELFSVPGWGYWMKQIDCVSINRESPRSTGKIYKELGRRLIETKSGFIMFPEGTRTRDPGGAIGEFKAGAFRLATMHGIPILPVSIDGTRYLSRGDALQLTRRGGRVVRLKIAPLIHTKAKSALERRQLLARVRDTIVRNFESIKMEWPCQPARQPAA